MSGIEHNSGVRYRRNYGIDPAVIFARRMRNKRCYYYCCCYDDAVSGVRLCSQPTFTADFSSSPPASNGVIRAPCEARSAPALHPPSPRPSHAARGRGYDDMTLRHTSRVRGRATRSIQKSLTIEKIEIRFQTVFN